MKYNIIYADPPWAYADRRVIRKDGRTAKRGYGSANLYKIMTVDEIASLPVQNVAADNCALFLWATWPHIESALTVMKAWGFRYITCGFDWVKTNKNDDSPFFGVGYYSKSNTEPCLFGLKGKMKPASNSVSQVVLHPHPRDPATGKIIHSRKPGVVRERIVELFGDLPRLEMFATEITPGWTATGYSVDGADIREFLTREGQMQINLAS